MDVSDVIVLSPNLIIPMKLEIEKIGMGYVDGENV